MYNSFIFFTTLPYWTFQYGLTMDWLFYIVREKGYHNEIGSEIWQFALLVLEIVLFIKYLPKMATLALFSVK